MVSGSCHCGKVTFEVYPANQLGRDYYSLLTSGLADIAMVIPFYAGDKFPATSVTELPGLSSGSCEATGKYWELAQPAGALHHATAMRLAVIEFAGINHAGGIEPRALPHDAPAIPVALVGGTIGKDHAALTMRAAIIELPLVDRAVGIARGALAGDLPSHPFAGIFKAVGQPVAALTMLQPVQKGALIDAAIGILTGDHLGKLGAGGACGQHQRQERGAKAPGRKKAQCRHAEPVLFAAQPGRARRARA